MAAAALLQLIGCSTPIADCLSGAPRAASSVDALSSDATLPKGETLPPAWERMNAAAYRVGENTCGMSRPRRPRGPCGWLTYCMPPELQKLIETDPALKGIKWDTRRCKMNKHGYVILVRLNVDPYPSREREYHDRSCSL